MQSARFVKSLTMGQYRSVDSSSSTIGSNSLPFQFADVEEEFLHAAEFGDVPNVKKILAENADLNIDCIDALGRTALRLAVKNEHLEVRKLHCVGMCLCLGVHFWKVQGVFLAVVNSVLFCISVMFFFFG